ncbi:MAG: glycosyltransferase [candidate division KSB1 bacterium]|nr:glycosyltransferase [candidate division KSB1 bacterium]MDZ7301635.1 glycosyltransferase [candidate division KSB1 bacterium]MDZ7313504.1 glycosyltransferase [candidate division KSB1 bacterium]
MPPIRRILHLAPFNTSGVPITLLRAERELGFDSRLITLGRDPRGYEEDVCLDLPFLDFVGTRWAKKLFSHPSRLQVTNIRKTTTGMPPTWAPHSLPEKWLVAFREFLWQRKIAQTMSELDFWNFDLYQLEGGLEFFRDGRTVRELKKRGKRIICLYTGSDLRTRGIIPAIDGVADLHLTLEFDHLALYPRLQHVFFPLDIHRFSLVPAHQGDRIVIGHAPTHRAAKGSDTIIAVVRSMMSEFPIDLELIEGLPYQEALRKKAQCDIFIDQIGELGYGINALEALAMGICACSSLVTGFAAKYPDHPFVEVNANNLRERLIWLCRHPEERQRLGRQGREWVERMHDARQVVRRIHELLVSATTNQ